eukprot:1646574-Amphidinium_carterae.1
MLNLDKASHFFVQACTLCEGPLAAIGAPAKQVVTNRSVQSASLGALHAERTLNLDSSVFAKSSHVPMGIPALLRLKLQLREHASGFLSLEGSVIELAPCTGCKWIPRSARERAHSACDA